jgi:hypothetical protein
VMVLLNSLSEIHLNFVVISTSRSLKLAIYLMLSDIRKVVQVKEQHY